MDNGQLSVEASTTQNTQQIIVDPATVTEESPPEQAVISKTKFQKLFSKKIIIVVLSLILLLGVGSGLFILNRSKNADSKNTNTAAPSDTVETTEIKKDTKLELNIPEYAKAPYSSNSNGTFIGLVVDGKTVIDRSEYDWNTVEQWGDWIIFLAHEPRAGVPDLYSPVIPTVHAFNLETYEYKIGQSVPPLDYATVYSMLVRDNYLYLFQDEYKLDGQVLRCMLSEDAMCTEIEVFYKGTGWIEFIDDENVVAFDAFGDAGIANNNITLFNPNTGKESKIINVDSIYGIGIDYKTLGDNGLLWLVEGDGNDEPINEEDIQYQLVKLFAINTQGQTQATITPDQFPIDNPVPRFTDTIEKYELLFVNDTEEVVYNINTREFGPVQPAPTISNQPDKSSPLQEIQNRLKLPENYSLVITKE